MKAGPIPIRDGVEPAVDVEREMRDYVWAKISAYCAAHGAPASIAFVLIGPDQADAVTQAHSWSPADESKSRLQCCATAAAVLFKRALGL